ncbi:hypothetical protein X975_09783, partial [Stegodyphus mimosarum]
MNYRVGNIPPTIKQHYRLFHGTMNFKFSMREFEKLIPQLDKSIITVTAYVGERYLNLIEEGYSQAMVFSSRIKLEFLGSSPQIFKPGMPYKVYVAVFYQDGSALPPERLIKKKIEVTPTVEFRNGGSRRLNTRSEKMSSLNPGIWEIDIDLQAEFPSKETLRDIKMMTLESYYRDEVTSESARAQLRVYAAYSSTNRFLQVTTSTRTPKVGEYIIFHV